MSFKLLNYEMAGAARAGLLVNGVIYDIANESGNTAYVSTMNILRDWRMAVSLLTGIVRTVSARSDKAGLPLEKTRLLAPVLYPGAIYCAGTNYVDHIREMELAQSMPPGPTMKQLGERPWHFMKSSRSTVCGHNCIVTLPAFSKNVDWEVELVAVIGRTARNVSTSDALHYIAGYTIANDLSARDAMVRSKNPASSPFRFDWLSHKSFEGSCPLGPWITPAEEIKDPHRLDMKLWVDDELMQDSNTKHMMFSIGEQVAELSSCMTLHPGDLILTGTPAGVGMARKKFLKPGQTVKLWIEHIGDLKHQIA